MPSPRAHLDVYDGECRRCERGNDSARVCVGAVGQVSKPRVLFVDSEPNGQAERTGWPMASQHPLMDDLLRSAGLEAGDVAWTHAVKCRSSDNASKTEIKACSEAFLWKEIAAVGAEIVVLMGATPCLAALRKGKVGEVRGKLIEKNGVKFFPVLSPGASAHSAVAASQLRADFTRLGKLLRGEVGQESEFAFEIVDTPGKLRDTLAALSEAEVVSYDIETTGFDYLDPEGEILMLGLSTGARHFIIPIGWPGAPWRKVQRKLGSMLEMALEGKKLVAHNGKFDNKWLASKLGWHPFQTFDTMLASHLLDENSANGLKPLSKLFFDADDYELPQPIDPRKTSLEVAGKYCALDVHYTFRLYEKYKAELAADPQLQRFFLRLLMPASRTVERVELSGVYVDLEKHPKVLHDTRIQVNLMREELQGIIGRDINWNSTQQVAKLLFQDLGLTSLEKTKGGADSVSESVLLRLRDAHPVVEKLLTYREHVKLLQFLESWREHCDPDGFMHPTFKLHGTVTGRLSCADPNLQQVPRDKRLRPLITAPPGWLFVEADYSQVELRVAAMLSGDPTMLQIYSDPDGDIHYATAMAVTGKPKHLITDEERKKAKAVNFGFLYGMGAKKFVIYARDNYGVKISLEEAERFRAAFFDQFYGLPPWHERQRAMAKKHKRVRNLLGRVRRLPEVDSGDKFKRGEAERQAINSPVQGFASDMMLYSFVRILGENDFIRGVGLVHDAGLFMIREDMAQEGARIIKRTMEDTKTLEKVFGCKLSVPIIADVKVGPWGLGKKVSA